MVVGSGPERCVVVKFLVILFMNGVPQAAVKADSLESCIKTAVEVNADPTKPAEAHAACYVLRESA